MVKLLFLLELTKTSFRFQNHHKYKELTSSRSEPHIYHLANRCYTRMIEHRINQSILISGESGSGKTFATKKLVQHIAFLSKNNDKSHLHDKVVEVRINCGGFGTLKQMLPFLK